MKREEVGGKGVASVKAKSVGVVVKPARPAGVFAALHCLPHLEYTVHHLGASDIHRE